MNEANNHQETVDERLVALHPAGSVSDTPRTDAEAFDCMNGNPLAPNGCWVVKRDFARQLEQEVAKWKENFMPFALIHAARYGAERYGKDCIHFTHYDMLKEAGARLVDFKRCGDSQNDPIQPASEP